jgi:UDP-GlcNAc:undecaprenyl-phosphate GlcNAc-1-phosphate transferase
MNAYALAFVGAGVACAALTPLVRRLALRAGAVSLPGGRHVHERAIPRLGGIAIVCSVFAPMVGLVFVEPSLRHYLRAQAPRVAALVIGVIVLCALGVLDDLRRVRARRKLCVQVFAALLAFACGLRIEILRLPVVGDISVGVLSLPLTVVWIVGVVNAINLIDGLDGLAGGVVCCAALTNLLVAYVSGATMIGLLMAATLGAAVGFLFYNFNPARIFMGDSGSYSLGFILAATSVTGAVQPAPTTVSLLVPVLALGMPIFDTLAAMVRRVVERRPILSPDRAHLHHRLLDRGITHRRAVLILYGINALFTLLAIAAAVGTSWHACLAAAIATALVVALMRFVYARRDGLAQ